MSLVHLHLLLNHVPVIGIVFVAAMLIAALRMRSSDVGKLGLLLLVGVGAATAAVYFTSRALIHDHEEAAEVSFIAASISGGLAILALLWYRKRDVSRAVVGSLLVLTLAVSGLMAWTANLGGQIRHSEIRSASVGGAVDEVDR